jgi:hypothetical protein
MYAETFNVQAWLEPPAKWLRWAMQSQGHGNTQDARWNLQQFWKALEPAKSQAKSSQDWGDILTLDAQSQWALGNLLGSDALDLLKRANQNTLVSFLVNPTAFWRQAKSFLFGLKEKNPDVLGLLPQLNALERDAKAAYERSKSLAAQAEAAYRKAGTTQHQARNTATVSGNASKRADAIARSDRRQLDAIATPIPTAAFLGLPMWAWGLIAVGAALLITSGPQIVAMGDARTLRKATV